MFEHAGQPALVAYGEVKGQQFLVERVVVQFPRNDIHLFLFVSKPAGERFI